MKHKTKSIAAFSAACMFLLAGCQQQQNSSQNDTSQAETTTAVTESSQEESSQTTTAEASQSDKTTPAAASALTPLSLSKSDTETQWDDSAVKITLSDDGISASDMDGISINGSSLTITKENTYLFSGTLSDGSITVSLTDEKAKAHLVFNGVSVTSKTASPLNITQADKVILTLADGTENTLADAASDQTETIKACLYAKDDLTINGKGTLAIHGNANNGIQCSNDLKLLGGKLTIEAANHGVRGDDSVSVKDCTLSVTAQGDGICTKTTDKEGKGNVFLESGTVTVNAAQDGIDSAVSFGMLDGKLSIICGGGTENAAPHTNNDFPMHGGRNDWGGQANADTEQTTVSTKGIKAGSILQMQGGTVEINSADDCIHSNQDASIGGTAIMQLSAGDDGIHADNQLTIAENAEIQITESYEGLEAYCIQINGGKIHVRAHDDGLNAAGGDNLTNTESSDNPQENTFGRSRFATGSGELNITDGYLYVNADGDGLDSNGDITITGGTILVCGPTENMNGPLDCGDHQNTITVTGGTLLAVGSTGMMETPEKNYIGTRNLNASADTLIVITDGSGAVLGAFRTPKTAEGLVFSANGMADGYQVYTGGTYEGTENEDGWAVGGTYTAGTLIAEGSGGVEGQMPPEIPQGGFEEHKPPEGFEGQRPPKRDGEHTPPDMSGVENFEGHLPPYPPSDENDGLNTLPIHRN